jgi:hypothetical protein
MTHRSIYRTHGLTFSETDFLERGIHGYFPFFGGRGAQSHHRSNAAERVQLEALANQFVDGATDVLPAIARIGIRVLMRSVRRQSRMPLTPSLRQQLVGSLYQAARSLVRHSGRVAMRALPAIVQRVGQNARRHGLSIQTLPQAIRHITRVVAHNPRLLQRLSVAPQDAFDEADWDEANRLRTRQSRVGPYRRVRGHHIHQAASYGGAGRSRCTNPNYRSAIAIAHGPTFTRRQHRRADAVQRNLNRAYRGQTVNQPRIGKVRIRARGAGTLAPTPNPYFEDIKAYYALRAAGVPAGRSLTLVNQSAAQLERSGTSPVRVPTR